MMKHQENRHILIVDDTESIHDDMKKILLSSTGNNKELDALENFLFEENTPEQHATSSSEMPYIIDDAFSGEEAIRMADEAEDAGTPYALIYMDVRMPPGINGIETIAKIWEKYPNIEMVICTAYSDYSWDKIVETLGETDRLLFMKKPVNTVAVQQMTLSLIKKWNLFRQNSYLINNLENEVDHRTAQLNDLLEKFKEANKKLNEQNELLSNIAVRDSLTGLLNHAALHENLSKIFSQATRHTFDLSVVMLDVDKFKELNDTYGHQFGDEVLLEMSNILKEQFRPYDIKIKYHNENEPAIEKPDQNKDSFGGRYGGDEFVLILPHCGLDEIDIVANRLTERIRSISLEEHPDVQIRASIGIAVLEKKYRCRDPKNLIALADNALYISKKEGRDRTTILSFTDEATDSPEK